MDDHFSRREYYRIHFPLPERPRLILEEQIYEVIDCSARGLRYALTRGCSVPEMGGTVEGKIRFRRGTEVNITGVVVRVQDKDIALYFPNAEIPTSLLLKEQRYLHAHYPMWS